MADAERRQQRTETLATLYVGKLRLERRNGAPKIFARAYVQGKLIVRNTGERTLSAATKVATDWYLELRDRMRRGERLHGRSFAHCAGAFLEHAELLREVSDGQRKNYREKRSLLEDHFDGVKVTDVDTKFLLELREPGSDAPGDTLTRDQAPLHSQSRISDHSSLSMFRMKIRRPETTRVFATATAAARSRSCLTCF